VPLFVTADSHLVSRAYRPERSPSLHSKRFFDKDGNYNITIIHVNDVHAHLDQFAASGAECAPGKTCYGGYARIKTKVAEMKGKYSDSLVLNAGDEFQGTLYYTVDGPSIIAQTLNQIGFDAMTLGNHEFDGGEGPLVDFMRNLTFPVVCANINSTNAALQQNLIPYKVFPKHGLALIAVTTADVPMLSAPGNGTQFLDPVATVQRTVDHVLMNEKDVKRIIAMTHIGYDIDQQLARSTRNVHLIVGGHSHTLLGNFSDAAGPYPTIERNLDGDEVFIVTAKKWGQYLGKIDVAYDAQGKIVAYTGAPILMDNTIAQEPRLQAQVNKWRKPFQVYFETVVGESLTPLDSSACGDQECTLGNAISDAILEYRLNDGAKIDGAWINAGGIRASIDAGKITQGDIMTAFPFPNRVCDITLPGNQWWDIFETVVSGQDAAGKRTESFVQVSRGIAFEYDRTVPPRSRLLSLKMSQTQKTPTFDQARNYTLAVVDYVTGGGDNLMPKQSDCHPLETLDVVFSQYVKARSPIQAKIEGRIRVVNGTRTP
ncbi:hypothetical protein FRB97_001592, partial [Tulasnella sp. 331]